MSILKKLTQLFSNAENDHPESNLVNDQITDPEKQIVVYGTKWCYDTKRALAVLDSNNIVYRYVDIDQDPQGAKFVESVNRGYRSVPTIIFPDGSKLVEPADGELKRKIGAI